MQLVLRQLIPLALAFACSPQQQAADAFDVLSPPALRNSYVFRPTAGAGFSIQIVDEPTTAPHDANTVFIPTTIWNAANGDAIKKWDVFIDGTTFSREERFYSIPVVDLFDKAGLGAGAILERTGVMGSAGEQVIVKTDGADIIVRVHGIEE